MYLFQIHSQKVLGAWLGSGGVTFCVMLSAQLSSMPNLLDRPSMHELTRYIMRTRHDVDENGMVLTARCTTHAACISRGVMIQPSGRRVQLRCKTGNVKDLNWNLKKHLRKWDAVLGTNDEAIWDAGKIHGPEARFSIPFDAVPCDSGELSNVINDNTTTLSDVADDAATDLHGECIRLDAVPGRDG
jgi:hypothetical protein